MIKQPASIFNDVIGPVMRGPSSSHIAAAARIGELIRQMVKGNVKEVFVEFDPNGALATTYHGHGSDIGFVGGLLGYDPSDPELPHSLDEAANLGIKVSFVITEYGAVHPNTYKITVTDTMNHKTRITAISVGGGMIEIQLINDLQVNIAGDFYETLLFFNETSEKCLEGSINLIGRQLSNIEFIDYSIANNKGLINIKTGYKLSDQSMDGFIKMAGLKEILELSPVLPIMSRKNCIVPFNNADEMVKVGIEKNLKLWELALLYERERGGISEQEVFNKMKEIVTILRNSIEEGLKGTKYDNRILGPQAWMIEKANKEGKLIPGNVINMVISYITALMEVKSSMGVIVAAPTAGSCGGVSGTLIGTAKVMNLEIDEIVKAMLVAGMIGVFIAGNSGFAAEVGGCQVECGAGSGMAAAGLVQLAGGTVQQGVDAASIALQNVLGMVCDPVAERVEVPCLGKNVMAGTNAIACANMALAGFDKVIPLDETLIAMNEVGKMLPSQLRCTGFGGLSLTETSKKIYKDLN